MRARLVPFGVCVAAFLFTAGPAAGQTVDPALQSDIVKLMELTGSAKMAEQMGTLISGQMVQVMRQLRPDLPPRAIEIVNEVLTGALAAGVQDPKGLTASLVPLYAKHFTHEDVRALLAFYQTEVGRKTITVMPTLFQEAAQAGQEWSRTIVPVIQAETEKRLRAEGFIK